MLSRNHPLAKLGFGDFINDCSGANSKILDLCPRYHTVGRGEVLVDIEITTVENAVCSLCHCGIEPKLSREEIEKRKREYIIDWTFADGGKLWYGDKWKDACVKAQRIIAILDAGQHIVDEDGQKLPEFKLEI